MNTFKSMILGTMVVSAVFLSGCSADIFKTEPFKSGETEETVPVHKEAVTWNAGSFLFLTWKKNPDAVSYELEIFRGNGDKVKSRHLVPGHIVDNPHVYVNGILMAAEDFSEENAGNLYWRVRALNYDGIPISDFSSPRLLSHSVMIEKRDAPLIRPFPQGIQGMNLLYPVYAYYGLPGASSYEVEVSTAYPDDNGDEPSESRVFTKKSVLTTIYDDEPRIGVYYWRVRGLDEEGNPVGTWSLPEKRELHTDGWDTGIFGDSFSHGGGRLSYSPQDEEYTYAYYLDFPVINLACSGDTAETMDERFERDVLPFHLKRLLIMGGVNSLRGGDSPEEVISELKDIQRKCYENGIEPILMTIPPINPDNIKRAFDEPTDKNWREAFRKVNDFIKTQPHIDTAAPFERMTLMPEDYATDGLHGDWKAKKMIAEEINRYMDKHPESGEEQ